MAEVKVTVTTVPGDESQEQIWVGPPDSEQALPCVRVPAASMQEETLKVAAHSLAVAIYMDYLSTLDASDNGAVN